MSGVFVGIDVSKGRLDVAIRPTGEQFASSNDEAGIARLVERLAGRELACVVLEVTGEKKKDKAAKAATARTIWVPAVNNHGGFGRWAYLEITDPWDAQNAIRALLNAGPVR